jgi:hypothetical protein
VLIENPDAANLWAHADVLSEAGYDVATCMGPAPQGADRQRSWSRRRASGPEPHEPARPAFCPMLEHGHCPLVEGADLVVSTTALAGSREIIATLTARHAPLVVEGTRAELEREADVVGGARTVGEPVTPDALLAAVGEALAPPGQP